jgi:hypothetical protein
MKIAIESQTTNDRISKYSYPDKSHPNTISPTSTLEDPGKHKTNSLALRIMPLSVKNLNLVTWAIIHHSYKMCDSSYDTTIILENCNGTTCQFELVANHFVTRELQTFDTQNYRLNTIIKVGLATPCHWNGKINLQSTALFFGTIGAFC